MFSSGLSWKLTLVSTALFLAALVAVLGVIAFEVQVASGPQRDAALLREARLLAAGGVERVIPGAELLSGFEAVALRGTDGDLRWSRGPLDVQDWAALRSETGPTVARLRTPAGVMRVALVPLPSEGTAAGALLAARREPSLLGSALSARMAGLVGLIVLVATGGLVWLLVRLWSRPMADILSVARSLSRGELAASAPMTGPGELGLLARSLNRMRDRLARNYETIDRQRRVLESLLSQLREGVVVADADGRIALVNPAAVRLLNLPPEPPIEALLGRPVERCIPQHDLQRLLCRPLPSEAEREESSGAPLVELRLSVDGPDGPTHLLAHVSNLLLRDGGPGDPPRLGRLLMLTDVTALTRTILVKTDFVTNASHELRTPLSAMRGALEALQRMSLSDDEEAARRFIAIVARQSARLEALASDLLDLARVEAPGGRFHPVEVEVSELLDDLRMQFSERMERKALRWVTDRAEMPHETIVVNPHLLRLVLDNLVDNAVKFTDSGKCVRVSCRALEGAVSFVVQDEGCGIPPEDVERVFERFYQVERARAGQERGTGLGLSIVRHAVAAMDGRVWLDSEPGRGTRVTVTIPQPGPRLAPSADVDVDDEQEDGGESIRHAS